MTHGDIAAEHFVLIVDKYGLTIIPSVLHSTRYVNARPTMASVLSSSPQVRPGTVTTSDCSKAIGRELEFMNIEAAIAKFLGTNE